MDTSTQPEGWPNNLVQTLFSLESWDITDPLAVGINTYALYINFSSRNNGPQYEAWEYGTFTGELFVGTDLVLFENYIDIDGDSVDDVSISLTVLGLLTLNEGFGFEPPLNPLQIPPSIPDTLWLRPTFQWKIDYLNENDPIWDELEHMEVSLLKGLAFNSAIQDSQSYAIVLDTRLTQPPNNFRVEVGIQEFRFSISNTIGNIFGLLTDFLTGGVLPADALSLVSISAPYSISIRNSNDGEDRQTKCYDSYYDVFNDHGSKSETHKCGYGVGIGFIQFDQVDQQGQAQIIDMGYLDVGFHPEYGSNTLPEEVDLILRNDNLGDNTFDTVEVFSDAGADLWLHYLKTEAIRLKEARLETSRIPIMASWPPSGSLPEEEINAIYTMIGEAPGVRIYQDIPERLSFILAIKNFSGDVTANQNDLTLPVNPAAPPATLIMVAGTERIKSLSYNSTLLRGGYANDVSSLSIHVENLPEVLILKGSFQLSSSGLSRVNFDNPDLNTISQLLDNALLTLLKLFSIWGF